MEGDHGPVGRAGVPARPNAPAAAALPITLVRRVLPKSFVTMPRVTFTGNAPLGEVHCSKKTDPRDK